LQGLRGETGDGMKCPSCEADGKLSTVTLYGETATDMAIKNFYDERGGLHCHNPNLYTTPWQCSYGHEGVIVIRHGCNFGCIYEREEKVEVRLRPRLVA
jgi:hypothetical protein